MRLTRHNGRSGKNGAYNPKHNDRRFDLENSEHIDADERKEIFIGTVIEESQLPIAVMQMSNRIFLLKKLSRCITPPNMASSFSFRTREI